VRERPTGSPTRAKPRDRVGTSPDQLYGVPLDVSVDHASHVLSTFAELGLPAALVKALARAKITTPTPVQAAVIPDALAGSDVLGRAATGSGKTLAFGLPILMRLAGTRSKPLQPRALIVVPTRELAGQVRSSLEPMADAMGLRVATVYGGSPYDKQIKRLRAGADVVVATPGRLQDLINRGSCRLDRVEVTVLDEADHLCDLGFFPAVSEIVSMTPRSGQRMLLSATLDGDVDKLVRAHLSNAVTHDCDPGADIPDMQHHVLVTGPHNKVESTAALLRANPRSIVFTRTRIGATNLASDLAGLGVTTVDLHGSLSQGARERNLRKFRSGQADVVVATDVAARGIHVDGVSLVVHFDAPSERKAYLHRSGRTARAGHSGAVVTMTTARHVAAVTRLQKSVGVTALHHDARTAPQPMTAESLAAHGVAAADVPASGSTAAAPTRHTYKGSRHSVRTGGTKAGASQSARQRPHAGSPGPDRSERARTERSYQREDRSATSRGPRRSDGPANNVAPRRSDDRPHHRDERPQRRPDRPVSGDSARSGDRPRRKADVVGRPHGKPARTSGGTAASGGRVKKARWTAAEKRAAARR
jgi:superfamily II DNA/RNA helicase